MSSTDFLLEPGLTFGDWLHAELADNVFLEKAGFMQEWCDRVAQQLQADRPAAEHLQIEIPWLTSFTAFTAPGRYVYISRRLLERLPHDHALAFVLAHEIAHHDLGHLNLFTGPFARHAARLRAGELAILFFRMLQKRIYSPEWELDADRHALELCLRAGFDGQRGLRFFHIAEQWALDYGDLNAVYGLYKESDDELSPEASVLTKARIWLYQRQRGYLPIRDRRARAEVALGELLAQGGALSAIPDA